MGARYDSADKALNSQQALVQDLASARQLVATTYSRGSGHPAAIVLEKEVIRQMLKYERMKNKYGVM